MKKSESWKFKSIAGKVMMGLALAALIGSIEVAPAAAGEGHRDNRRYEQRGHGHYRGHGRGYYRDGRRMRAYGYVEPVYVAPPVYYPPPVYYAPPPAPGVSIFLPTIHIR